VADDDAAGVGEVADHREVQFPLGEDGLGQGFPPGLEDHEHALLALGEHHLVGGHAFFALGDVVQREVHAHAALAGHLDTRAGEAGGAHVLDGDDGVGGHQLQAGLDEEFFREGVADLDGGALFFRVRGEFRGGHGGAVDAVPAGLGADIDHGVADAGGGGGEDAVGLGDADRHRVDQGVAVVGGVEVDLSAHGRDADAVAVAADAADHAVDHLLHPRRVRGAEAQGVEVGDGPRAHGEDIPQDAADPGGSAVVGFDPGRVVVGFHLEDGGQAIPDGDDAGILARALDDPGGLGGEFLQPDAAGFVGAVFRPHHGEHAELGERGGAAEDGEAAVVFVRLQAEFGGELGGTGGVERDGRGGGGHARVVGRAVASVQWGFARGWS
jgi:hypothetical protein